MTQTVLITGTSSGFGKAIAQRFLDQGWNVIATMRRPDRTGFDALENRLLVTPLDVTQPDTIRSAIDTGIKTFGAIDVVVNNAGIGLLSAFEETPEDLTRDIFETNTFGVMAVCHAAIPVLRAQGRGTIVNVTSSAAIAPMPLVAVYTASKCAIEGFTESLTYELAVVGIKAKLVEPGLAPTTRFGANASPRMDGLTPPPYADFAHAYLGRMQDYPTPYATETDVADAVFAAATDGSAQLRYPAGPDAQLVAKLRWATSEPTYTDEMRRMFVPSIGAVL